MKYFLIFLIAVSVYPQTFRDAVFLHHSTGGRIWDWDTYMSETTGVTSIPDEVTAYNTAHSYTGGDAVSCAERWWPTGNAPFPYGQGNDWYDWHWILDGNDPVAPTDNFWALCDTFSVIITKSCGPSSMMYTDSYGSSADTTGANVNRKSIYNYKWHWRNMVKMMENHPDNFFVIWTGAPSDDYIGNEPPQTATQALYSHYANAWLKDTLATGLDATYGAFPENVYIWEMFHRIVDEDYFLQPYYRTSYTPNDGHPNEFASDTLAPLFVNEIFDAAIAYEDAEEDTIPTLSTFTPITGAELNSWHLSNGSLVGDLTTTCTVYAAGDSFKVNSGAMRVTRTTVTNGDYIYLSGFASGLNSTKVTKTITAGSTSRDFDITTKVAGIVATMPLVRSPNGKPIYDKNGKALWK